MTWRMSVIHRTSYLYESEVVASFNELRMTPVSNAHQLLVYHQTSTNPFAPLQVHRDYWGSTVEAFDLHTPHLSLEVVSENIVETSPIQLQSEECKWHHLDDRDVRDQYAEYLVHTKLVPVLADVQDITCHLRSMPTPQSAVDACVETVRERMTYTPGATHVYTSATEAWSTAHGVCQDYSHITLSLLRSAGIPARYVSGYHYTGSDEIGDTVVGESHAWLEAWVGDWMPIDPTNDRIVDEKHVVVAYGRDYHDVSPLRGIFSGGQGHEIDVSVSLTRLAR